MKVRVAVLAAILIVFSFATAVYSQNVVNPVISAKPKHLIAFKNGLSPVEFKPNAIWVEGDLPLGVEQDIMVDKVLHKRQK